MSQKYIATKLPYAPAPVHCLCGDVFPPRPWCSVPCAPMINYVWAKEIDYKPHCEARVGWTEEGLHVFLLAYESKVRTEMKNLNDAVCTDSCMEFFLMPTPDTDKRYLNFEVSAAGVLLLGIGTERNDRTNLSAAQIPLKEMNITSSIKCGDCFEGPAWSVSYFIPFSFLKELFGEQDFSSGKEMRCNFYKCGDDSDYPHWGTWAPVRSAQPDYHRPECFGTLILG